MVVEYTFDSREAAESFVNNPAVKLELARADVDDSSFRVEYLDEVAFSGP